MRFRLPALLLCCAGAVHGQQAPTAADGGAATRELDWSGFATLGVARSNSDAAEFIRYNQASGVKRHLTAGLDTNAGLQLAYAVDPATSLMAQAVVHRQVNDQYQPELALAFVKRQLGADFSVRVGRLPASTYMISEYQHVGYALTMARPPVEVYGLAPLESVDGADLRYQHSFGATTLATQLIVGHGSADALIVNGDGSTGDVDVRTVGISMTLERGPLLLRAGYYRARIRIADVGPLAGLRAALAQAGFPALSQQLTLEDGKRTAFASLGLLYDAERWQVQGEYVRATTRDASFLPEAAAWYAMAGYRLGAWLPYYGHARLRQTGSSVMLPADFPASGPLARAVREGVLTAPEQHTNLVGLRWNLAPDRALKAQLDHVRPTAQTGTLVRGPAAGLRSPITVMSLTLDLVF